MGAPIARGKVTAVPATFASTSHPPRPWEALTSALLILGSVVAVLHVVAAVALIASGASWGEADGLAVVALLLVETGWLIWTKRILRSFGDDGSGLGRHWTFQLAWALLVVDILISGMGGAALISSILWAAALAAGLLGLVKVREIVRGVIGGQIEPYTEDPGLLPPIAPDPTVRYEAPRDTTGLAAADDVFWAAVSQATRTPGAALLETTASSSRRWLALPVDGDITAVRSSVPLGATVTLWPAPLSLRGKPPAAPEYYGLLQTTAEAPIRFQLVLPSRVPAFIAEARTAHLAGLYLPTDQAACTVLQSD